jgi:hypothetical protein
MTVEADLYTLLKTQCDRVFPDFAPLSTVRPYVTYQKIGGRPINVYGKLVPNKALSMYQINVWADTRIQADALSWAIDSAMRTATVFDAKPETDPVSVFEDDEPNLRGTRQDFAVVHNR